MKRVCFLPTGNYDELCYLICYDTDHNGLNELIFERVIRTYVSAWMVWEYRPFNRYELVFADTGAYPYPPGVTTGNFRPYDVGDIDQDGLTDLVGPNIEKPQNPDTFYNLVTTQESPNYFYYPESLSWWYRHTNNAAISQPFYFPPDLDSDNKNEIMFVTYPPLGVVIFENVSNNRNVVVWNTTQGLTACSFTFGDFDGDGHREFVTAGLESSGKVYVYENTIDNQYEKTWVDTVRLPNGLDVFSGQDLDGDGKSEFFVGFAVVGATFYLYMWEAIGDNTYERTLIDQKTISVSRTTGRRSKCGDIDGDGIEELVWATPTYLFVYKAIGNDQFQQVWQWYQDHGNDECLIVNIFDMNKNGYNEIVVGGSGKISIFEVEAVRLLRPNGGENFSGNSQEVIKWQTFYPPRCDSLSLFFSQDNGRSYEVIATGIPGSDTSYLWQVPNLTSDSCLIKIVAYGPGWQYDESDGVFRITAVGMEEGYGQKPPGRFEIYPNPASSHLAIRLLPTVDRIRIYDVCGKLVQEILKPNKNLISLKGLTSGVYFLKIKTNEREI
ncbi:MAG: T9SS type A sorting domain-containing protein, partial [candidate division WOR-3 bacterium]